MLHSFRDVIDLWDSPEALSDEIRVKPATVYKWRQRGRIPVEYWILICRSSRARDAGVTPQRMAELASIPRHFTSPVADSAEADS